MGGILLDMALCVIAFPKRRRSITIAGELPLRQDKEP